jgi:hypothetical protein
MWLLICAPGKDTESRKPIRELVQLAFLMLDPDPEQRITVPQLVHLLHSNRDDFLEIRKKACGSCCPNASIATRNTLPHSVFRKTTDGGVSKPIMTDLSVHTENLWAIVKARWLEHHMHELTELERGLAKGVC